MKSRIAPDWIMFLNENEIFVFGSNLSGIHGGGAAFMAKERFGAISGIGVGMQGQSYAIPTKSHGIKRALTEKEMQPYINEFVEYAKEYPETNFLVTEVGCGLAGISHFTMARLFHKAGAFNVSNIALPIKFRRFEKTFE